MSTGVGVLEVLAVVLLAVLPVGGALVQLRGERARGPLGAVLLSALLGLAAVAAAVAGPASSGVSAVGAVLAVLAAALAGGPVATAVLGVADPTRAVDAGGPGDPEVLRGGATIGLLERIAVAAALLAGWPEGLPVVLAVKGLGRLAELRASAAAERFIIGTLSSVLWAVACVGVVELLRR